MDVPDTHRTWVILIQRKTTGYWNQTTKQGSKKVKKEENSVFVSWRKFGANTWVKTKSTVEFHILKKGKDTQKSTASERTGSSQQLREQ